MANSTENGIFLDDLLESENIEDSNILIMEDTTNTKKITFQNLRKSLISDDKNPSGNVIYSAKKVIELIDPIEKAFTNDLGLVKKSIDSITEVMVDKDDLKLAIDQIDDAKLDKTGLEPVLSELENTRKNTDKIASKDLSTGSDADKIHLGNLGSDVLDAMTGKTQVSIPSVPTGGWVEEDIANSAITAKKLAKDYQYRGQTTDTDLDRLVESGLYVIASSAPHCPHYGNDESESRLLEVTRYGDGGKYIKQKVYYHQYDSEARPVFIRKGLFSKLSTLEFVANFDITDLNKIGSDFLADTYDNRGSLSTGNLFEVNTDGNYLCESTVQNLPTVDKYIVSIHTYGDRKEYIAKKIANNGSYIYSCYEYPDISGLTVRTDWKNESGSDKSKFDSKKLIIFGDDISTANNAKDGTVTSQSAYFGILASKYGWIVNNKSCVNATASDYGKSAYTDSNLQTTIDNMTDLATSDDAYVAIFVGSEDYAEGIATVGVDTNTTKDTFKGALNLAINKILTRAPHTKILLVTPIYRASIKSGDSLNGDTNLINNKYLRDFATAIKDIADYNHIPCLDLYNECMINKYNSSTYLQNGILLNEEGHAMVAEKIHDGFSRFY